MLPTPTDNPTAKRGGPRCLDGNGTQADRPAQAPIASLFDPQVLPALPDWSYRQWWQALQYRDVADRAHAATREQGRQRDALLGHPAVAALVEWAGRRRRRDPIPGAAAALVALRALQACPAGQRPDGEATARWVIEVVDRARPLRVATYRRDAPLFHPDRLVAGPAAAPPREHPRLAAVVIGLLRLAGADPAGGLVERAVDSVVQAADWWATHAVAVPSSLDGPGLPGIAPAQELAPAERLAQALGDRELLGLVGGPHPGRGRPCQVAWRRGLTYWTAVHLAAQTVEAPRPPAVTVRWWRTQLAALTADSDELITVSAGRTLGTATGSPRNVRL